MIPDHDPSDQADDTDQQTPTGGIEAADVDAVPSEEVIRKLLTSAILQGLSASDEELLAMQSSFRGPVPPPEMMNDYDAVVQDGAERIMIMAEKSQDAAIADRKEYRRAERRGQTYALIFVLATLAVGAIGIVAGQPILGSSVTILCLASVVYAFIRGRG